MRQFFCVTCEGLILKSSTLFCSTCYKKVFQTLKLKRRKHQNLWHFYLFEWNSQTDFFCRSLAYFLKSKPRCFFADFTFYFESVLVEGVSLQAVVPGTQSTLNHAASFAEALMKLFSFQGVLELELQSQAQKQKGLSRQERFRRSQGVDPLFSSSPPLNWAFVDDVLVSGATLMYAQKSLGSPPLMALTLFYKSLE